MNLDSQVVSYLTLVSCACRGSVFWLSAFLTLATPALAAVLPTSVPELGKHTAKTIYQPLHKQYLLSASQFLDAAHTICKRPTGYSIEMLRSEFNSLVAEFAAIELYRVGPLMEENRYNRNYYWPDKRQIGERQLRDLLAGEAAAAITHDRIIKMSVPCMVYLRWNDCSTGANAETHLMTDDNTPDCHIVVTIAGNLVQMADSINQEWQDDSIFV